MSCILHVQIMEAIEQCEQTQRALANTRKRVSSWIVLMHWLVRTLDRMRSLTAHESRALALVVCGVTEETTGEDGEVSVSMILTWMMRANTSCSLSAFFQPIRRMVSWEWLYRSNVNGSSLTG